MLQLSTSRYQSLVVTLFLCGLVITDAGRRDGHCEPLTIPMCSDLGTYNETILPNMLNHVTQEEAGVEVHQFYPLVKIQCSPYLQLFLCSVYAPPCALRSRGNSPIPPCRSLCRVVRAGCLDVMSNFGFSWPDSLKCRKFPKNPADGPCVEFDIKKPDKTPEPDNTTVKAVTAEPPGDDATVKSTPIDTQQAHTTPILESLTMPSMAEGTTRQTCNCQCECTTQP